jgi:hypothetical protein
MSDYEVKNVEPVVVSGLPKSRHGWTIYEYVP